jgi:hypothetical protein
MSQPQPPHPPPLPMQFPAAKWIQNDNEDSDNDQVGLVPHNRGYKNIIFFFFFFFVKFY